MYTATTSIYTLSLHDALPIFARGHVERGRDEVERVRQNAIDAPAQDALMRAGHADVGDERGRRSEEHTSELQSLRHLVCRLLLEKKKERKQKIVHSGAVTLAR